jgi:predicted HTH transcriptional regulator
VSRYIANLIKQGEHQQLDFKHSISDSRKIARSLAAFANTDGGTLLVGVKDNGNISGVNSEEEYYMLEGAAQMYCKPEVKFKVTRWDINGKVVLEVVVKPDKKNLYKAQDKNGKWKVFFREKDENFVATPLQVKVWNAIRYRKSIRFSLSHKDQILIDYLKEHKQITVDQYCRVGFLPHREAENALTNLAVLGIVNLKVSAEKEFFVLTQSGIEQG